MKHSSEQIESEIESRLALFFDCIRDGAERPDWVQSLFDFTPESLEDLDDIIDELWPTRGPSEENLGAVVACFGAYVAAVVERNHKGIWVDEDGGWLYRLPSGFTVAPFNWTRKRFTQGERIEDTYGVRMKIAANFSAREC
jgi:hypothetical protein